MAPEVFETPLYSEKPEIKTRIIPAGNFKVKEIEKDQTFSHKFMPDISNYSLRDAITILTKVGIKYKVEGSGIVVSQSISPGEKIAKGMTCIINCSSSQAEGVAIY